MLISNHHHFHLLFFVPKWLNLLKFNLDQFANSIAIIAALNMKNWNRFGNQITIIIVHTNSHRRFARTAEKWRRKDFPIEINMVDVCPSKLGAYGNFSVFWEPLTSARPHHFAARAFASPFSRTRFPVLNSIRSKAHRGSAFFCLSVASFVVPLLHWPFRCHRTTSYIEK